MSSFKPWHQTEMSWTKKYYDNPKLFMKTSRKFPPLFLIACIVTIALNLTLSLILLMGYQELIMVERLPMIFIQNAIFLLYLTAREFKRK